MRRKATGHDIDPGLEREGTLTRDPPSRVSELLAALRRGDVDRRDEFFAVVYNELKLIARQRMAAEPNNLTLQPTALVHEAYLRLLPGDDSEWPWENRAHFFASAAEAMRRILVERARRHARIKHGGAWQRIEVDPDLVAGDGNGSPEELLELDQALNRLEGHDRRLSEVVKLRYFAGLGVEQVARVLGVSSRTVDRDWMAARTWLYREVSSNGRRSGHGGEDTAGAERSGS